MQPCRAAGGRRANPVTAHAIALVNNCHTRIRQTGYLRDIIIYNIVLTFMFYHVFMMTASFIQCLSRHFV